MHAAYDASSVRAQCYDQLERALGSCLGAFHGDVTEFSRQFRDIRPYTYIVTCHLYNLSWLVITVSILANPDRASQPILRRFSRWHLIPFT